MSIHRTVPPEGEPFTCPAGEPFNRHYGPQPVPAEDPAFYWDDLNDTSERDLRHDLDHPAEVPALFSIISEADGGIIGYAIGLDHANLIVDALKRYAPAANEALDDAEQGDNR